MNTIKYTCEVITPMFLHGADGVDPELRSPSIKGGLRFWFRAINGHLSIEELRHQEGQLFGDTKARSKLSIRISGNKEFQASKYPLLPHREGTQKHSSPANAIVPGQKFEVSLSSPKHLSLVFNSLFQLLSLLGGIGKRSRRGMGAFRIHKHVSDDPIPEMVLANVEMEAIGNLIKAIAPHSNYVVSRVAVNNNFGGRKELYPWVKQIQLGKRGEDTGRELLRKIGLQTSSFKSQDARTYEASMGHANRGRFASPVYVSIVEKDNLYFPIITH